jgi:hypothetical protein
LEFVSPSASGSSESVDGTAPGPFGLDKIGHDVPIGAGMTVAGTSLDADDSVVEPGSTSPTTNVNPRKR